MRTPKEINFWVIQRRRDKWEDVWKLPRKGTKEREAEQVKAAYILSEPQYRWRLITRREPNPNYKGD